MQLTFVKQRILTIISAVQYNELHEYAQMCFFKLMDDIQKTGIQSLPIHIKNNAYGKITYAWLMHYRGLHLISKNVLTDCMTDLHLYDNIIKKRLLCNNQDDLGNLYTLPQDIRHTIAQYCNLL